MRRGVFLERIISEIIFLPRRGKTSTAAGPFSLMKFIFAITLHFNRDLRKVFSQTQECTLCSNVRQGGRGWLAFGERNRIPQPFRRGHLQQRLYERKLTFVANSPKESKPSESRLYTNMLTFIGTSLKQDA